MDLGDIERELGGPIVDAVLVAALGIVSDDPDHPGYQARLDALEELLAITLALTAYRSGAPVSQLRERLSGRVRDAVGRIHGRDVAVREMGLLTDVPSEWGTLTGQGASNGYPKRLVPYS